jgi:hypothetical protein
MKLIKKKNCPNATLSTKNPTWTDPCLHDEGPETSCLSHGTVPALLPLTQRSAGHTVRMFDTFRTTINMVRTPCAVSPAADFWAQIKIQHIQTEFHIFCKKRRICLTRVPFPRLQSSTPTHPPAHCSVTIQTDVAPAQQPTDPNYKLLAATCKVFHSSSTLWRCKASHYHHLLSITGIIRTSRFAIDSSTV